MPEILLRESDGAIAILTLNRPDQLNALSEELMAALQDEFDNPMILAKAHEAKTASGGMFRLFAAVLLIATLLVLPARAELPPPGANTRQNNDQYLFVQLKRTRGER